MGFRGSGLRNSLFYLPTKTGSCKLRDKIVLVYIVRVKGYIFLYLHTQNLEQYQIYGS